MRQLHLRGSGLSVCGPNLEFQCWRLGVWQILVSLEFVAKDIVLGVVIGDGEACHVAQSLAAQARRESCRPVDQWCSRTQHACAQLMMQQLSCHVRCKVKFFSWFHMRRLVQPCAGVCFRAHTRDMSTSRTVRMQMPAQLAWPTHRPSK